VVDGGSEYVFAGATAIGTVVDAGGLDLVSGGTVNGVIVNAGGDMFVHAGAQANSTTISAGGAMLVLAGATVSGATLDGGFVVLQSGSLPGTSLFTISAGTLVLDDSQHFSGTVAGLANSGVQNVDLADIAFTSATHVVSYTSNGSNGGTVEITDGTNTALLNVLGTYTALSFKLSNDGTGGTNVTDPPVSSGSMLAPGH
jgi:autotransporter passenger strand-loop-strand repeat protein